jgi:hypothetical protein
LVCFDLVSCSSIHRGNKRVRGASPFSGSLVKWYHAWFHHEPSLPDCMLCRTHRNRESLASTLCGVLRTLCTYSVSCLGKPKTPMFLIVSSTRLEGDVWLQDRNSTPRTGSPRREELDNCLIGMVRVKMRCCLRVGEQLHFATRHLVEAMHGF